MLATVNESAFAYDQRHTGLQQVEMQKLLQ